MSKNSSVISDVIYPWRYLGKNRKTQLTLLAGLTIVAVFAEMLSIGAVIPFVAAILMP